MRSTFDGKHFTPYLVFLFLSIFPKRKTEDQINLNIVFYFIVFFCWATSSHSFPKNESLSMCWLIWIYSFYKLILGLLCSAKYQYTDWDFTENKQFEKSEKAAFITMGVNRFFLYIRFLVKLCYEPLLPLSTNKHWRNIPTFFHEAEQSQEWSL